MVVVCMLGAYRKNPTVLEGKGPHVHRAGLRRNTRESVDMRTPSLSPSKLYQIEKYRYLLHKHECMVTSRLK